MGKATRFPNGNMMKNKEVLQQKRRNIHERCSSIQNKDIGVIDGEA